MAALVTPAARPVLVPAASKPGRTVLLVAACALGLHLVWLFLLADSGGDLAAQDAWTEFAVAHPGSAYDFAWYGGLHPASYSLLTPFLMGLLGVRLTTVVVGTLSAALVALLLTRRPVVTRPLVVSLYAAVALTGNAVSGRATFGVGLLLGLAALTVVVAWPDELSARWETAGRILLAALLSGSATAASPVAGLFLGLLAAALWLRGRRSDALVLGTPPVVVVAVTALAFPFSGLQPISWRTVLLPLLLTAAAAGLVPRGWHLVRAGCLVHAVAVVGVWVVPSPIGTNVTRLALLFGGVVLVAAACGSWWTSPVARRLGRGTAVVLLAAAIVTSSTWQVVIAARDAHGAATSATLDPGVQDLVAQLEARGAHLGRVEVVPTRSHREASALAPHVSLARGWNRQADVARNPMFYREAAPFSAEQYHRWLRRWAVRLVVLPRAPLDYAGLQEGALLRAGAPFLEQVWSDATWTLYQVRDPAPLVSAPAQVLGSDAAGVTVWMPDAGTSVLRIAWSPWLALIDSRADPAGRPADADAGSDTAGPCLSEVPPTRGRRAPWVRLTVTHPGTYRIGAPYQLPRGSPCPEDDDR